MGGWYMREISIYKLQIPNKLQKANYKTAGGKTRENNLIAYEQDQRKKANPER
jgi:hypothetical protein